MHVDNGCRLKNHLGTRDEVIDQGLKLLRETLHEKMYWLGDQTTHHVDDNCTSKQYDVENSEKNKELHLDEQIIVIAINGYRKNYRQFRLTYVRCVTSKNSDAWRLGEFTDTGYSRFSSGISEEAYVTRIVM